MRHRALDEVYCSVARTWAVLGDRYKVEDPPVRLFHKACGEEAAAHLVCSHCAEPVAYGDLRAEYAPGAW